MVKVFLSAALMLIPLTFSHGTRNKAVEGEKMVWICTGEYAYAYHKNKNCRGLNRCSCEIKKVTLKEAKKRERSKPCKICYK